MENIQDLKKEGGKNNKNLFIFLLGVVVLAAIVYFVFSYVKTQKELRMLKDPTAQEEILKKENDKLISKVGELIDLPVGEEPVIGTVQDAETLAKEQKFFISSKNGDRVLIYQNKAIIYRPEIHKLINVGPVYLNSSTSTEE
ncbi:MAG: hypothetical protein WC070_00050 [Candidatus Magasanikbacteria bacterium]